MAYNMSTDTYNCDICGFELKWGDSDDILCFIDRYGIVEYKKMMQQSSRVYCPSCWEEHRAKEIAG